MGYVENNLMKNEKIIYESHLHWAIFISPLIWLILAIILFNSEGYALTPFGSISLIVSIILGISASIKRSQSEFFVTDKRVILKIGLIRRISLEILLTKIEGIQVNQGILGRILGYGSITVSGSGGAKNPFHKIYNPLEFRKKVQEQIDNV